MKPARQNLHESLIVDEVTFAVRRSARRHTIGITIPREGLPIVAAPTRCSRATLETVVRGKLAWVRRKLGERVALAQLPPHRYEAGERFPYLGDEYELVVVGDETADHGSHRRPARRAAAGVAGQLAFDLSDERGAGGAARAGEQAAGRGHTGAGGQTARRGAGGPTAVRGDVGGEGPRAARTGEPLRLRAGRFELAAWAQPDGRAHFAAWYRRRAAHVLGERIAHWAPLVGVAPPPVAIRDMRSRWGSCSAKGRVSLHWGLVVLPLELADYVVVHELVHLLELNHGPAFWRGVARLLPDYRERRKSLRAESARSVI